MAYRYGSNWCWFKKTATRLGFEPQTTSSGIIVDTTRLPNTDLVLKLCIHEPHSSGGAGTAQWRQGDPVVNSARLLPSTGFTRTCHSHAQVRTRLCLGRDARAEVELDEHNMRTHARVRVVVVVVGVL